MRGTGGNRFIESDADAVALVAAIQRGVQELEDYAAEHDRVFDVGAIDVETSRIKDGRISVTVTGDLPRRNPT